MTLFLVAYFLWSVYALLFSGVWLIQKKTKNAGIVDVVWTYATGAAGIVLILYAAAPLFRKVIVGAIVLTWTLRLGLHLTIRYLKEPEDGRYTEMRKRWGDKYEKKMYFFYQLQQAMAQLARKAIQGFPEGFSPLVQILEAKHRAISFEN